MDIDAEIEAAAIEERNRHITEAWKAGAFEPSGQPKKGIKRVVGSIIAKGIMTVIAGSGGASKSTLLATVALGIAAGRSFVGPDINSSLPVLHLGIEDDQDMNERMFHAAKQKHSILSLKADLTVLGEEIFRSAISWEGPFELLYSDQNTRQIRINEVLLERVKALITTVGAEVVVIDPLAVLYGGVQMTNEATNILARTLKAMAQELDIALVVASHTRKPSGTGRSQDQHDVKFGSELVDTARCVINVGPLSEMTKNNWAKTLPMEELNDVRMAVVTKTNIGKGGDRFYYRVSGQSVMCEDGDTEIVGAIERWSAPSVIEVADVAIWPQIKKRLDEEFVYGAQTSRSQPKLSTIIEDLGGDYDGKKVAADLINRGWVEVIEVESPSKNRSKVKRAVVGPNPPARYDNLEAFFASESTAE